MATWQQPSLIRVVEPPSGLDIVVVNGYPVKGQNYYLPDQWHQIDISADIPPESTACWILGRMQISKGSEWQDKGGSFRVWLDPSNEISFWKCRGSAGAKGNREQASAWVPLTDGKFDFRWNLHNWEDGMQASINLKVMAVAVPQE